MAELQVVELPIEGMDCAECTLHVQKALSGVAGVASVQVFLASEKAIVQLEPGTVNMPALESAVSQAGYQVRKVAGARAGEQDASSASWGDFTRPVLTLLGVVFGAVLFVVVAGEWLGLFEAITSRVPWPVGWLLVLVGGFPVFLKVLRAALNRQIIAHTLMTVGVLAALAVGEWGSAAVVVFFMRVGDYTERFTAQKARRAVKDLTAMAPKTARLQIEDQEVQMPVDQVQIGQVVVVRPGEQIPVDGEVIAGHATVDQSALTGEAMPVEVSVGMKVYAATLARLGSLRVRVTQVGADTTFGRVIRLVEEAEAHRAEVQRIADKFSAWYLPVVAGIAALTLIFRRDPLATAAVLVVACSCSFALATPIAMLASIGAGARRGLMIKGGKYLELLARADTLLIDKTGTLTLGKPEISEFRLASSGFRAPLEMTALESTPGEGEKAEILRLAASAERYSEHPLAEAVRLAALQAGVQLCEPQEFIALPGFGVQAVVDGVQVMVGNRRMLPDGGDLPEDAQKALLELESQARSVLLVWLDGRLAALLAASDRLRPEAPQAIQAMRQLGIRHVELLTGDHERSAAALAQSLGQSGIRYRAGLLPEDKIAIVRQYQAAGHVVIMLGDGVNDAPALAQADIGMAMRTAGTDIALEAAHIALMREDWMLAPAAMQIAQRTMRVVKTNLGFTLLYNLVGLTLAALGWLPPIFAAAAQSLPDLGILANSARLLRD